MEKQDIRTIMERLQKDHNEGVAVFNELCLGKYGAGWAETLMRHEEAYPLIIGLATSKRYEDAHLGALFLSVMSRNGCFAELAGRPDFRGAVAILAGKSDSPNERTAKTIGTDLNRKLLLLKQQEFHAYSPLRPDPAEANGKGPEPFVG